MNIIPSLQTTGDALNAERIRMDVIAQNIANAQTTRDVNGKAYQRKVVSFEAVMNDATKAARGSGNGGGDNNESQANLKTVRVSGVTADTSPGERVYNPASPDADKTGYVEMPNVKMAQEMVDLITSSRAYEANLTVAKNGKAMADSALRMARDQ
jgi:flagellar basal-body rod protein FlgC